MSALPEQYSKYRWQVSATDSSTYRRYGAGVERFADYNHRYQRGEDYIMLGVDISFVNAVPSHTMLRAAQRAWITLRFTVPTVAVTTENTPEDDALLVYHVAPDPAAVEAWAERTVELTEATTLEDARIEIDRRRPVIPDARGDQTFLYIVPRGSATKYALILYGSHVPFDGVGYQAIMTRYLAILARYLADDNIATQEHSALIWGTEHQNLALSYLEVVSENEPLEGPVFDNTLNEMGKRMRMLPVSHLLDAWRTIFSSCN
jgi:hypothetical protein